MKEIRKILLFLIGSALLGALLAPWLYWGGRAFPALAEAPFARFFDRAVLVAAVALLWPTIRSMRFRSRADLGLERDPLGWRHLAVGFCAGVLCMALFAAIAMKCGVYRWKTHLPWGDLGKIAVSACTVATLEEWLFRGALLGIFRRALPVWPALFAVSALFSILHFVKPPAVALPAEQIDWLTGLRVLPSCFAKFSDPALLAAGFTTLFLLGCVLGWAAIRTRALWLGIGLHAGLVFAKFGFNKLTKRKLTDTMPWIGDDMIVGFGALGVVALSGALCWAWLHYEHRTAGR